MEDSDKGLNPKHKHINLYLFSAGLTKLHQTLLNYVYEENLQTQPLFFLH